MSGQFCTLVAFSEESLLMIQFKEVCVHSAKGTMQRIHNTLTISIALISICVCIFAVFIFSLYLYCKKCVKLGDCCGALLAMAMGHASCNFFAARWLIYFVWLGSVWYALLCMMWRSSTGGVWYGGVVFARGSTDAELGNGGTGPTLTYRSPLTPNTN